MTITAFAVSIYCRIAMNRRYGAIVTIVNNMWPFDDGGRWCLGSILGLVSVDRPTLSPQTASATLSSSADISRACQKVRRVESWIPGKGHNQSAGFDWPCTFSGGDCANKCSSEAAFGDNALTTRPEVCWSRRGCLAVYLDIYGDYLGGWINT